MGRFSCFCGHVHNKQKKPVQPSFDTKRKMLQIGLGNNVSANSNNPTTLQKIAVVENVVHNMSSDIEHVTIPSRWWKSGELNEYHGESNTDSQIFEMGNFRRSLSAGCELDQKGRIGDEVNIDQSVDHGCSNKFLDDKEIIGLLAPNDPSCGTTSSDQDQEAHLLLSPCFSSDPVNHKSGFSVCDPSYAEKEGHNESDVQLRNEHSDNYGIQMTPARSTISKCHSMPNFGSTSPKSPGLSSDIGNRSFEDLSVLIINEEDASAPEITELNREDSCSNSEKNFEGESSLLENYDSYNFSCSSKDWIVPVTNGIGMIESDQGESSSHDWDQFPNVDLKIKSIEDWVTDLQHFSPAEESNDFADSYNEVKRSSVDGLDTAKVDTRINPGMEAAKRYISSLNAAATTAQLANHGLVVIPLLSTFVGLKVLNLSGNSIVRITAGALPRGLHMLNLSKNKLSTIEGLRELTRLRILDLSYNKVSRIGHGLASCSSLKELYLAGNKISEVEGLHRLQKLSVLDLRFNKIATSKGLGQLAANYNSLQAISLEGNPCQKNVGDEQLKKYLMALLPHLAYYNQQHIKTSTLKVSSDRSVRLGISAHQFDFGLRSYHKTSSRRGIHGYGILKQSALSYAHGPKGSATDSPKQSRGRHELVPPSGARTSNKHHHIDLGDKLQSLRSGLSLHKSRSEGNLAAT